MDAERYINRMHQRVRAMTSSSSLPDASIFFADPVEVTEEKIGFYLISSQDTSREDLSPGVYAAINIDPQIYLTHPTARRAIAGGIVDIVGDRDMLPQLVGKFVNLTTQVYISPTDAAIRANGETYPLLKIEPLPMGIVDQYFPEPHE